MEGVGRVAAVGTRIGERADDVEELCNRSGPAMGEEQGDGPRLRVGDPQRSSQLRRRYDG